MNKMHLVAILFSAVIICVVLYSCQPENQLEYARYYTNGQKLYAVHCQNCHGKQGEGLAKLIPPLTDTIFLKESKSQLACIIKYGTKDSLKINSIFYSTEMLPNPKLPDMDIAAIITYITNSFGNRQGLYNVNNATTDLKKCLIN